MPSDLLTTLNVVPRMTATGRAIAELVSDVARDEAIWRPAPDRWSIVEVICHLADEEREDFRVRLDLTLHDPTTDWPTLNPQAVVAERRYAERDLADAIRDFQEERARTIEWFRSLDNPVWEQEHTHPRFGSMSAGDLMASWLAHDLLHLRQLSRLRWEYLVAKAHPFDTGYAGEWPTAGPQ